MFIIENKKTNSITKVNDTIDVGAVIFDVTKDRCAESMVQSIANHMCWGATFETDDYSIKCVKTLFDNYEDSEYRKMANDVLEAFKSADEVGNSYPNFSDADNVVIKYAIEKFIPQKPLLKRPIVGELPTIYQCPCCGKNFLISEINEEQRGCPICLQAIDFSEIRKKASQLLGN